ncbi:hypothetical protein [Streptomyces europaeiscabiei]|uniref:hypothetical protein n=1 Tax=Streptomyces europaeiscabiei TaxID=146819 RepID=UPI0029BE7769|nr:hypothetical protein [Streptomyces europaeiscabiei]MDX3585962.1 hypothetical protein [Streptomyces europaeiscabiei]
MLTGRDELSDVFDDIGDAARRLGRRMTIMSIEGDRAVRRLSRNASRDLAALRRDTDAGGKAMDQLKKATLLLAPAAIPAAASLAPIAAGAGTVAVAVGVMGAAMIAQVSQISEASEAHKAYKDAVDKSGASSQEAVTAQLEYQRLIAAMPPATRRAAAAVSVLKDETREWSDSLAGDTMAPFVKGVALTNALLPKTRDLVKGTSAETDRFMTILGGTMASPGFDALNAKFTTFSNRTLRDLNSELVGLLRTSQSGEVGQNAKQFMTWARAQGPTVASVLNNVGTTLMNVLEGGSEVGVGLLQTIDFFTRLVSAVPPSAIAIFLQLAIALKLTKAAALGLVAARTALAGFGIGLVAMNTAAAAAPGRLAAVRAAVLALSRTTKIAMAGTGIGLAILAVSELAERSGHAPPDIDRLTTSLRELGSTGKVTGEASKAFGSDLEGLYGKVRSLTDPSTADDIQQFLVGWTGWDSTPVKEAKENIDSIDKSLADMVKAGNADLAAAALKKLTAEYGKGGRDTSGFTKQLNDYKAALKDAKFEQELAAQSQGLFGAQAQKTQAALAAQKASADGLRQSLQALNDMQRQGLGGMIGFEASIDAAAKAAKENAGALDMVNGRLDVNSPKAQAAATALNDLAAKTEEAAASARESGSSWQTVSGIYSRGREQFIKNAQAMGLNRREAKQLADQILNIKDLKKARVELQTEDAEADIKRFNSALNKTPGAKSVTLKALSKSGEAVLESFGYKVKRLPDGSVTVTAKAGKALSDVQNVAAAVAQLHDKSITIFTQRTTRYVTEYQKKYLSGRSQHDITGATGGLFTGSSFAYRGKGYADGGLVEGPGTGTSDSVFAPWLSAKEFVVNARQTARNLPLLRAINDGKVGMGSLTGGVGGAGAAAAQGLASGMAGGSAVVKAAARRLAAEVLTGMREELQISSPSKKAKALMADLGKGLIAGMTGSKDKIKSTAKDLAKDIWAAFDGKKDNRLVAMVNRQTKKLLDLAGQRDRIAATIKRAKDFAESSRVKAKQDAGLGGMFGGDQEEVSAGGIKGKLASRLEKMKQFSRYISELAKRGLNKTMLREILEMGPEQGYAYASALAGADKATFNQINSTQYKINDEAKKLGRKGADALYDSGKNAGKGFLAGLASQQKSIEALMVKIAKAMQKALRKALGISSPAKAMIPDGINAARGVGVGVLQGLPFIDQAMSTVAGRMAGRAAGFAAVAGRPAVAASSGPQRVQVDINVSGTSDPVAIARELQRQLLQLKRAHGINVSLGVG